MHLKMLCVAYGFFSKENTPSEFPFYEGVAGEA
jgi:hypothetical protein